ncbi:hypothetical protein GUITHDRAFT_152241 [Guillardia theta CCMP2712]|uniref:Uncharacterized protein n=1 Tax=Guillardia theta (strain CCMP2712) TaxID=905079 RepID=L1JFM1_GUITC|nr:hypothetical protein GUITHDRAFT_152241 [Guillardia theta CCMP2712]EKX46895.1 hypothetical protein GUITHDRAFT_152241 [Guillardia theta CCMP2712]|eukprot:XP_005833875.1 hypothetical protein GUITHDRAFT_152241 [Guillardia theta CCMP2712]
MVGLRAVAAIMLLAVIGMVAAALSRSFHPAALDFDPVNRGVYGPWRPMIRRDPSQGFIRHHVLGSQMSEQGQAMAKKSLTAAYGHQKF